MLAIYNEEREVFIKHTVHIKVNICAVVRPRKKFIKHTVHIKDVACLSIYETQSVFIKHTVHIKARNSTKNRYGYYIYKTHCSY